MGRGEFGELEAARAVYPGLVQGDRLVSLKTHVLLTCVFGHSESCDYFRTDLVGQGLNQLEKGEYFMQKVLLAVQREGLR